MMDYAVNPYRLFLGDQPPRFLREVLGRTLMIYLVTLLLLRWMGKRGMGQLTPFEFAIIVGLGSAVGDPMIYDDVPLLPAMVAIAIVVGLQRALSYCTRSFPRIERLVESRATQLVDGGRIDLKQLRTERLSREELFEMLRTQGIAHLGQVRYAYLEPSGRLSVIRWQPERPGLPILPTSPGHHSEEPESDDRWLCCVNCGRCMESDPSNVEQMPCECGCNHARIAAYRE